MKWVRLVQNYRKICSLCLHSYMQVGKVRNRDKPAVNVCRQLFIL